jgi:hypothetical protein
VLVVHRSSFIVSLLTPHSSLLTPRLFFLVDSGTIDGMNTLAVRFGLPAELETLIDTGVIEVTGEDDVEKTLHPVIPSLRPMPCADSRQPTAYPVPLASGSRRAAFIVQRSSFIVSPLAPPLSPLAEGA